MNSETKLIKSRLGLRKLADISTISPNSASSYTQVVTFLPDQGIFTQP
jgi:hypothetical protein